MLVSLQFNPAFLERNEKLQTVYEIESFTGMAHDDAKVLFVSACVKNYIVTLTKDVTKEEFVQMDKNPTNCITINEVDTVKESSKRDENCKKLTELYWKNKYEEKEKELASLKGQCVTTNIFDEPIVMLRITKYNQMKLQLKEYSDLKQQSNNDAIKADKEIKRLQKLVDSHEKNANRYSKLRSLLETTLNQFK